MLRAAMRVLVLLFLPLAASAVLACGSGSGACTEIGCEHEAIVTFPAALVDGPYDLVLRGEAETSAARCFDPTAPETAENPAGIECDLSGFTLRGHALANESSVFVTVVRVADEEVLADDIEVRLEAVDMSQPNGPDCPPTCFIRNGQLILPSAPE